MPTATGDLYGDISSPFKTPLNQESLEKLPQLVPRKRSARQPEPTPVLETPTLSPPPDLSSWAFETPSRRILSPKDHETFLSSSTRDLIVSFVFSLSESARDRKISSVSSFREDPTIRGILAFLDLVEDKLKACPPVDQGGSRFGNPAFRDFLDSVGCNCPHWHKDLGLKSDASVLEVSTYLQQSFGNKTRIDYGSGHELNFVIWLLCLNRLSLLPPSLFAATSLVVFPRYINLMRDIQSTYYLEPAGSHGVWGLDDYQFLPFLFGASQLAHHPYIRPLSIHNDLILEEEGDEFVYLDMIRFTMASKTVKGLKWTQPMLDDISGAKSWEKVENGMRRMFVNEVLGKLPVMQHFLFGSLVPAIEGMNKERERDTSSEDGVRAGQQADMEHEHRPYHVHRGDEWGDCCGIKIPSNVAAAEEERRKGERDTFRRIPFD